MLVPQRHRGFTLIEQLVAATVMLIIFISVTQAFIGIGVVNNRADAQTEAVELMQQKLEQLRNTPYNDLIVGTTDFSQEMNDFESLQAPRSATIEITEVTPGSLSQVDITVSYTKSGSTRTVATTTLIGLRGINR
jgi:prepilin-type N-terminal cleavage/methylation domain-containing protein